MISGLPRPAMAGSANCAPAWLSLRNSGSGLISLFIGMKPATIVARFDGKRERTRGNCFRRRRAHFRR